MPIPSPEQLDYARSAAIEHIKVAYEAVTSTRCTLDDVTIIYCLFCGYAEAVDNGEVEAIEHYTVGTMIDLSNGGGSDVIADIDVT